jgi:molybdopterin-guanine dinucleotide biosynthesis protein A
MTPTTAVVLAGGAIDAAWQQRTGARTRAEVPVGDAPMYLHVVRALRQVDAIGNILLIGDAPAGEGYTTLPPRDSLLENVRLGLERSPTDSALFATVDLPFLTPESVRFFYRRASPAAQH